MLDSPEEEEEARERLAEFLVAAALRGFDRVLQPRALEDIRSYLVDELLCTSYGLARLRRLYLRHQYVEGLRLRVDAHGLLLTVRLGEDAAQLLAELTAGQG